MFFLERDYSLRGQCQLGAKLGSDRLSVGVSRKACDETVVGLGRNLSGLASGIVFSNRIEEPSLNPDAPMSHEN